MKKRVLLLDVGGVLILSKRRAVFANWAKKLGRPADFIRQLISDYNAVLASGKSYSVYDYLADRNIDWIDEPTFEQLRRELWASEYLNMELLSYVLEHSADYTFALLTNNFRGLGRLLNEKFKIPKFYKAVINSSDIGLLKPDPSIFLHTLKTLNVAPEDCIFVDDKAENVKMARELKMEGIIYTNFTSFQRELESLNQSGVL